MAIHKQSNMPIHAQTGDAWLDPNGSFKRVLSRGGAWENVNLGTTHPDEVDHEQESSAQPETVTGDDSTEVSLGTGESAPGDGDDGETVSEPSGDGEKDPLLEEPFAPSPPGVDGNGSEVV